MEDVDDVLSQSMLLQFDEDEEQFSPNTLDEFEVPSAPSTPQMARSGRKSIGDGEGRVLLLDDPANFHVVEDFFVRKMPTDEKMEVESEGYVSFLYLSFGRVLILSMLITARERA